MGLGNGFDGDRKMVMGVLELCSHEGGFGGDILFGFE